ncbi:protein-glutamine gamma-glutamyltransferase K-like [Actinia tenebrosa]|uniref:Protein-glutamine gamma-glutamyltransferase K-like n=1 Tax=Actinia tenebrosa TaxID=6105 RepID=A0A6P8JCY6_ACTTE|nr:protein-glutamine gamma-glutamyltransferase K-like [Actinia tenebrosa]
MPRSSRRTRGNTAANSTRIASNSPRTTRRSSGSGMEPSPPKRRRAESPENDSRRARRGKLGENVEGRTKVMTDQDFKENMKVLHANSKKMNDSQLKPVQVDLHVDKNREEHYTDDYEMEDLIVRRGKVFKISVTFDRNFDESRDKVILQFVTGPRPQQSKKSIIRLQNSNSLSTSSWGMHIVEHRGATVEMSVMSPADAIVGEYSLFVETRSNRYGGNHHSFKQKRDEKIIILFNAWCKDDAVYMGKEDERKEYVLNDRGRIWVGSKRRFTSIPWNFGQFDQVSLETCLKLLKIAELSTSAHANPTLVCRTISQMANYNDKDGGILFGRWTETYPKNSTEPTEWTGSVTILKKFTKRYQYVRYGQCWVFSGLVTTLLRAIGIPTRSVTNFASAHDNDQSMTIDYHHDAEGKPLDDLDDSVWNFHVWNESYFTRPDLPSGYDGWQAHDATPQETSEGVFRCGPCPVKAVKNGEVYFPFDTGFVFAEVNGDKVYWDVDEDGEMTVSYIDKRSIGKYISTKAVGSNDREDLTKYYKFPEESSQEREAVRLANKFSSRKNQEIYSEPSSSDVTFEILTSDNIMIGDDVKIELSVKNDSNARRTVQVTIVTKISFYTGITTRDLKNVNKVVTLARGQETSVLLSISVDEYLKMAPDASIKTYFKAKVKETGQVFCDMDDIEFNKPELIAMIPYKVGKNEEFEVSFQFTNPLPIKLTNANLNVENSRMIPSSITKSIRKAIGPNDEVSIPVILESKKKGKRYIDASFHSDQLSGVRGEFEITVV